jgi:DNA integrity scanning protein DisA with diadenylate cyclase activity
VASVVNFLQQNWRAAVEIMILTVGIYYVINFIRGTRGASVVMGFVGCW